MDDDRVANHLFEYYLAQVTCSLPLSQHPFVPLYYLHCYTYLHWNVFLCRLSNMGSSLH
jgi:hypothetical protein